MLIKKEKNMNLSISPINVTNCKKPSFGMAKFSSSALQNAQQCSDIFECFSQPHTQNRYFNPEFVKETGFLVKKKITSSPFAKYADKELSSNRPANVENTIRACGLSDNYYANAMFAKQLLSCEQRFQGIENDDDYNSITTAVCDVFKKNWDNPYLPKEETVELLDMTRDVLTPQEYHLALGLIERSDIE